MMVNVQVSLEVGREQVAKSETTWTVDFHDTTQKKITTMAVPTKGVRVGATKVFDTKLIFSRVVGIQDSSRQVDIKEVLAHESAPIPTSMFTYRCRRDQMML